MSSSTTQEIQQQNAQNGDKSEQDHFLKEMNKKIRNNTKKLKIIDEKEKSNKEKGLQQDQTQLQKKENLLEEKKMHLEYLELYKQSQEERIKKENAVFKQHTRQIDQARRSTVTTIANMVTLHALQDCQQPIPEDLEEGVGYFRDCINKMTLRTEPQSNWRQQREYFIKCYTKLCSSSLDIVDGSEITFNDLANEISEQLTSSVYPEVIAKQKKGNKNKNFKKGEKTEAVAVQEVTEAVVVEEEVQKVEEKVAQVVAAEPEPVQAEVQTKENLDWVQDPIVDDEADEVAEVEATPEPEVTEAPQEQEAEQEEPKKEEQEVKEETTDGAIAEVTPGEKAPEDGDGERPRGGKVNRGRGRGRGEYRPRGEYRGRGGDGEVREYRGRGDYRGRGGDGEYRGRGGDGEYRGRGGNRGEYRGRVSRGYGYKPRGEDDEGFTTVKADNAAPVYRARGRGRGEYRPRGEYRGRGDGEYRGRGDGEYKPRGEYRGRGDGEYKPRGEYRGNRGRGEGERGNRYVGKGQEYAKGVQVTEIGQKSTPEGDKKE